MNEDGLGTLIVLPREIRDMVFSYVAASLKLTQSCFRILSLHRLVPISRQLRRELLESFLRNNEFFAEYSNKSIDRLNKFLRLISPMTDIATHIRAIGLQMDSELFDEYLNDSGTVQVSQTKLSHDIHRLLRRARKLRSCFDVYGIPLHKVCVEMRYILPLHVSWGIEADLFYDIVIKTYLRYHRIRIDVSSKARSVTALEKVHKEMLLAMQGRLEKHLEAIQGAEKKGYQDDNWADAQRDLNNHLRRALPAIASAMLEHHKALIDQVVQPWQDAEEFKEYCLGDFFALAEAW
ncbi:unnamed protein product [Aureobasidium mustum]|uniref:Uncharacterized protein n=1 Tax=Aureobasidium mustum TaxID=2773714 RepID=A0A9N8JZQ9_9PEZI|nr:unnamed protein product [Aureobasidium mustum]